MDEKDKTLSGNGSFSENGRAQYLRGRIDGFIDDNTAFLTPGTLEEDDRISAYLRGEMNRKEEAAFLKQLKGDKRLRRKAIAIAHLAKAMKHVGQKRDEELKEALMATDEYTALDILEKTTLKAHGKDAAPAPERKPDYPRQNFHISLSVSIYRPLLIAACVLLLGGLGFKYYRYRSVVSLGEEYCSIFPGHESPVRGSISRKASQELSSLYLNVRTGDNLEATVKRLSVLWELSTMDTYNDYTDEAPYIGWNLAIAYLKTADKESAKQVLTQLIKITDTNSLLHINAVNLQKDMGI